MVKETCPHSPSALPMCLLWPFPIARSVGAVLSCGVPCTRRGCACWGRPAPRHGCVRQGLRPGPRGRVRTRAGSRCPAGRGSGSDASPAPLSSPPPVRSASPRYGRVVWFMSFLQGPLIHELSLGSPLRRVTQSTGSAQASLAGINVSAHLLFVWGASAPAASPRRAPGLSLAAGRAASIGRPMDASLPCLRLPPKWAGSQRCGSSAASYLWLNLECRLRRKPKPSSSPSNASAIAFGLREEQKILMYGKAVWGGGG